MRRLFCILHGHDWFTSYKITDGVLIDPICRICLRCDHKEEFE